MDELRILYPYAFVMGPKPLIDLMALPAGVQVLIGEITSPYRLTFWDDSLTDRQFIHNQLDAWLDRYPEEVLRVRGHRHT